MYNSQPPASDAPPKLALRTFQDRIREHRVILGAASSIGSILCTQILSHVGFEWILIDMEHDPTSPHEATILAPLTEPAKLDRLIREIRDSFSPEGGINMKVQAIWFICMPA